MSTRTGQYSQHEVVGEDGTPVTIDGAGGSGTAQLDDNVEAPVARARRGMGGDVGRGRGRGPAPAHMMIGEA